MRFARSCMTTTLFFAAYGCASPAAVEEEQSTEAAIATAVPAARADVAELSHPREFVLAKVLERKFQVFDPEKPIPELKFGSQTSLTEFQDAIEPQWGFRPGSITNAYIVATNTIYLMDSAAYYAQHGRCIDDSLAHELTHYVQVRYQGWHLDGADDSIEMNAIDVQTWFREQFCPRPQP